MVVSWWIIIIIIIIINRRWWHCLIVSNNKCFLVANNNNNKGVPFSPVYFLIRFVLGIIKPRLIIIITITITIKLLILWCLLHHHNLVLMGWWWCKALISPTLQDYSMEEKLLNQTLLRLLQTHTSKHRFASFLFVWYLYILIIHTLRLIKKQSHFNSMF